MARTALRPVLPVRLDLGGPAEVTSWLPEDAIDDATRAQLTNLARLPTTVRVAVMPDAHSGYGMPIGCALATEATVVPYAVGVDIGCGMIAERTGYALEEVRPRLEAILRAILERVPVGMPSRSARDRGSFRTRQNSAVLREWAAQGAWSDAGRIRERADRQLGTLGSGNHFCEVQADTDDRVWTMIHTGSRSFGHAIGERYHRIAAEHCRREGIALPDRDLALLPVGSTEGQAYLRDMHTALRFAEESRARIAERVRDIFERHLGGYDAVERIETHHNFAGIEARGGRSLVIHRKGAVSTRGRPMVTIPGSMQTGSHIGRGIPNDLAFDTCAHGAGRRLGRREARRQQPGVDIRAEMARDGVLLVTPPDSDVVDEAGRAYKDIEDVMAYQADLVEPVVKLRPLGVVKG